MPGRIESLLSRRLRACCAGVRFSRQRGCETLRECRVRLLAKRGKPILLGDCYMVPCLHYFRFQYMGKLMPSAAQIDGVCKLCSQQGPVRVQESDQRPWEPVSTTSRTSRRRSRDDCLTEAKPGSGKTTSKTPSVLKVSHRRQPRTENKYWARLQGGLGRVLANGHRLLEPERGQQSSRTGITFTKEEAPPRKTRGTKETAGFSHGYMGTAGCFPGTAEEAPPYTWPFGCWPSSVTLQGNW